MTPSATADNTLHPSHAAARATDVPSATEGTRTLSDAIRAVNDHRREVEMRRMALAAQRSAPSDDWPVPVPRSQLLALEQQARQAAVLLELLDSVVGLPQPSTTAQPARERHLPPKPNQRPRLDARTASSA